MPAYHMTVLHNEAPVTDVVAQSAAEHGLGEHRQSFSKRMKYRAIGGMRPTAFAPTTSTSITSSISASEPPMRTRSLGTMV
jgi:hypothetical protein